MVNKATRTCDSVEKDLKMKESDKGEVQSGKVAHPLKSSMMNLLESNATEGGSLFEAKGGLRVAVIKGSADTTGDILKMPYIKRGLKDLASHAQLHHGHFGVWKMTELPRKRKVVKTIKEAFDHQVMSTIALPKSGDGTETWADLVYDPQLFNMSSMHVNVGFGSFCCMEGRLVLRGSMILMGIATEKVPGASFKEKRKSLYMSTVDVLKGLLGEGGRLVKVEAPNLVLIPTGFVVLETSDECCGLRWAVSGDASDGERVKMQLKELLASFPEMANPSTGYQQFYNYMCSGVD